MSSFECPNNHPHTENCYRRHGCRCKSCRADNALRAAARWRKGHPDAPVRRFIQPAGMTLERAMEIAAGATPRLRDIA